MTRIGVFDILIKKPSDFKSLLQSRNFDANFFKSLLSLAVSIKYLKLKDNKYYVAKRGLPLTTTSGSWLRTYLLVWGQQLNPALMKMENQLNKEGNAFSIAHRDNIWDFYDKNQFENQVFIDFMHGLTTQAHMLLITEDLNVSDAKNVLDVAGGIGSLACALSLKYPSIKTYICDQPSNSENALNYIRSKGLEKNCNFIGANIFNAIPSGFDLYTIKHVLHDWDDLNALLILQNISTAMRQDSRLIIIEGVADRLFTEKFLNPEFLHTRDIEQRLWTPPTSTVRERKWLISLNSRFKAQTTNVGSAWPPGLDR